MRMIDIEQQDGKGADECMGDEKSNECGSRDEEDDKSWLKVFETEHWLGSSKINSWLKNISIRCIILKCWRPWRQGGWRYQQFVLDSHIYQGDFLVPDW